MVRMPPPPPPPGITQNIFKTENGFLLYLCLDDEEGVGNGDQQKHWSPCITPHCPSGGQKGCRDQVTNRLVLADLPSPSFIYLCDNRSQVIFHLYYYFVQQPSPHSPTGDIAGVSGQNSKGLRQGGKPGTDKLYTDVCLCGTAHFSGCVVNGLGAMVAH